MSRRPGARRESRFYNGLPGRETVDCPDCGEKADAEFGDHGGDCISATVVATPRSALGLVRRQALARLHLSANTLRPDFLEAGISTKTMSAAITAAIARAWIEKAGTEPSDDPKTKRHLIQTYDSLIHPERKARDAAARATP